MSISRVWRTAAACSSVALLMLGSTAPGGAAPKKTVRISMVLPATGTQFGDRLRFGAEAAVATFGGAVKLKVTGPAQIDPSQEVQIFQNEVLSAPDAIIVGPIPSSLFVEPAMLAEQQGVKVAWIVIPPTNEVTNTLFVGNNEYEMGKTVGDLIADRVIAKNGADAAGVAVPGICIPGLTNLEDRLIGAKEALAKRLPKLKVSATIDTGNERAQNYAAWDQAVQANPNALALFDACEPGMINLTKIKEDDKGPFQLVVWDTPDEVLAGIKKGAVSAGVPPSHFISGYMSVYMVAKALLEGKPIPHGWLRTPTRVVDASNIDADLKAESSAAEMLSYFKPDIDKLIADMPAQLPPVTASHR